MWKTGKEARAWRGGKILKNCLKCEKEFSVYPSLTRVQCCSINGYKCQICDATGELQIDHIQSWAEFKELRFDPENCRTLCAKCHYKITFGREMPESVKTWGHNLERRSHGLNY